MTRTFINQTMFGMRDQSSGTLYYDYRFVKCRFEHCLFGTLRDPSKRPIARRMIFDKCYVHRCLLSAPILEDILITGLECKNREVFILWAPALRHVTLAGPICNLLINRDEDPLGDLDPVNVQFREANASYYCGVDWALDIREAEFIDVGIHGIPSNLIRRDPETQVVILREKLMNDSWRRLDLLGTYWYGEIEWFLDQGYPEHVLIAPKRASNFSRLVAGLRLLQKEGVAEPN